MEAPPFLTFASTIHDPENRLGYLIEEIGEKLRGSFSSVSVAYTPKTHPKTVSLLKERGYRNFKAEDTVVSCYQISLSQSLEPITGDIFYCDLDRALQAENIECGCHYPAALTKQPALQYLKSKPCRVSEDLAKRILSLPMHPHLTDKEVAWVIEAVEKVTSHYHK